MTHHRYKLVDVSEKAEKIQKTTLYAQVLLWAAVVLFPCSSCAGTCRNEMTSLYEEYIIKYVNSRTYLNLMSYRYATHTICKSLVRNQ